MENNDSEIIIIDSQEEKEKSISNKNSSSSFSSNKNSDQNKSKSSLEFSHFNILYINLVENFNKNKFRYVFSEIEKNKEVLKEWNLSNELIFSHFQIRCCFHIIEKKFIKYNESSFIKGIEHWFKLTDEILLEFTYLIPQIKKEQMLDQYELVNLYYLTHLYNQALNSFYNKDLTECLGYLSLCDKLIKKTSKEITYPDTLNIIQKIYLLLTILFIYDKDYYTAINYLNNIFHINFKELDIMVQNNKNIMTKKYKLARITTVDVFFNIIVGFFLLGVCYENMRKFDKSNEAYSQANYIGKNFITNHFPRVEFIINEISQRALNYYKLLNLLNNLDLNSLNVFDESMKRKKRTIFLDNINECNKKIGKYKKIQNYVEYLNSKNTDIDDDEVDLFNDVDRKPLTKKTLKIIGNVKLINYLTSDYFKPLITDLKQIKLNRMDNETKRKIQKNIFYIKQNKREELKKKEKMKRCFSGKPFLKVNKYINTLNGNEKPTFQSRINHSKMKSLNKENLSNYTSNLNSPSTFDVNSNYKSVSSINNLSISRNFHSKVKSVIPKSNFSERKLFENNGPLKINYDKYIFNKNYRKKINELDIQSNREYQYQKELLNLKKYELIYTEPFLSEKVQKDADLFFTKNLSDQIKILEEKNKTVRSLEKKRNEEQFLINKKIYQYEEKACKSLNQKEREKLVNYLKSLNKENKFVDKLKEKIVKKRKKEKNEFDYGNKEKIEKKGKEIINQIDYDLEEIENKKNFLIKTFKKK